METSFYNTTNETGKALGKYSATAKSQQERIYNFMKAREGVGFAPSQILDYVFAGESVPITSVRRAMTTMSSGSSSNMIFKTDVKYKGPMGRPEYTWVYLKKHMG